MSPTFLHPAVRDRPTRATGQLHNNTSYFPSGFSSHFTAFQFFFFLMGRKNSYAAVSTSGQSVHLHMPPCPDLFLIMCINHGHLPLLRVLDVNVPASLCHFRTTFSQQLRMKTPYDLSLPWKLPRLNSLCWI